MTAAVEESLGEVGLCTKGVNGGVEVPDLVLVFPVAGDVGSQPPVFELFGGISEVSEVSGAPLEEAEKPRSKGLVWGFGVIDGAREEFMGVGWFLRSKATR